MKHDICSSSLSLYPFITKRSHLHSSGLNYQLDRRLYDVQLETRAGMTKIIIPKSWWEMKENGNSLS